MTTENTDLELAQLQLRLTRCVRGMMRAWALRWKWVSRERDPVMIARRRGFIARAVECRDISHRWTQINTDRNHLTKETK